MTAVVISLAAVGLAVIALVAYSVRYFRWEENETGGNRYFARPLAERLRLKRRIRTWSRPAMPLVRALAFMNRGKSAMPSFVYEGVYSPLRVSSGEAFARATAYQPRPEDVFVVTQMRSGTTWMQQVVYEIVQRGRGDLSDAGHGHLYLMSPWIEALTTVSLEAAPLVGDPPTRIIKTHLPEELCPRSAVAKYVYVARHPVSCFASIVDYNRSLLGPLAPALAEQADWFCSDRMYWRPWPAHVAGWWERAEQANNVLFVHFEEMSRDLGGVVDRVATLLGCTLSEAERRAVLDKCSFAYMSAHEEEFEMATPTMFSVAGGKFLRSGKASRHEDVTPAIRDRILRYCREELANRRYPAGRFYGEFKT